MRPTLLPAVALSLLLGLTTVAFAMWTPQAEPGPLVVAGGGGTTAAISDELFRLGGGKDARMVLVPWASEDPNQGKELEVFWKEKGATHAVAIAEDATLAKQQLAEAQIIWMGGGDQKVLFDKLKALSLDTEIARRHREGCVVGGTSAGAAIQSRAMILGGELADLQSIKVGGTQLGEGLDLLGDAIVDQHFIKRQRFTRLLAAVLDRPQLVGMGVEERTAAIVRGSRVQVVGEGQVLVIDARKAQLQPCEAGAQHSARGLRLDVLRAGDTYDWNQR
jgi:cyanophycinase